MKEVSHGFCKKIQNFAKIGYVMITVNISSNLRCVVRSAVTNEFNTVWNMARLNVFKGKKY